MVPLFRPEAVEDRRRRVHGKIVLSRPPSDSLVTIVLVSMTLAALVFLFSVEFHRKETVKGYLTSSQGVIPLRAQNGGVLARMHVKVGENVQKGDPVFEATTDIESVYGPIRVRQLATTENRLREIGGQFGMVSRSFAERRRYLSEQREELTSRIEKLHGQLELNRRILGIAERSLERIRTLNADRYASDREVTKQLELVLTRRTNIAALENEVSENKSDLLLLLFEQGELPDAEARERSELTIRKNALQQSRLEQTAQGSYLVRAPVSGRISAIQGDVGQELVAQTAVVTMLPQDAKIVANLLAPSRAIGFLKENGRVNLLIDAFPYQKFGVQTGRIREVSRSSHKPGELNVPLAHNESAYKVVVELDQDHVVAYGQKYSLQVDMTLTGDLIVDRRRLIDWILEPLTSVRY